MEDDGRPKKPAVIVFVPRVELPQTQRFQRLRTCAGTLSQASHSQATLEALQTLENQRSDARCSLTFHH